MRTLILPAVALLTVGLVGCSGGGSAGDGRECLTVPADVQSKIAGESFTPTGAAAVRSESFDDATIVAVSFDVEGSSEQGVWAVGGSLDDPGSILSIDAVAATVTDWPNEMNGEKFSVTEDGVTEAKACLAALSD